MDQLIVLERPCCECSGKGGADDPFSGSHYPCSACDGTGFVLTESGERLLAFLQHAADRLRFRSQPSWPIE
jgi:DnaJ-class molecular chaperone